MIYCSEIEVAEMIEPHLNPSLELIDSTRLDDSLAMRVGN